MEHLKQPWVIAAGLLIGLLFLFSGRRGGSNASAGIGEANALASDTNVKLSAISAGTASSVNALRAHTAELDTTRYLANLDVLKSGISGSNVILLQHEQAQRDIALANISKVIAVNTNATGLKMVQSNNATTLRLGYIAGQNRASEIRQAPMLASIVGSTQTRLGELDYMARHDEARYRYKAAKARANADMVGSIVGSVAGAYSGF